MSSGGTSFVMLFFNNFHASLVFRFPISFAKFFEMSVIFFGLLFDGYLCWIVSAFNNKELISSLPCNCSLLSRAFKRSLLFDVLPRFYNNNADIECIAFKLIILSDVSCVHAFGSLLIFWHISFLRFQLICKLYWVHWWKVFYPFLLTWILETGVDTFNTSALPDIVTGWLDEKDTTFINLLQCRISRLKHL